MLISRWKPVCPECAYSLRRLTAPRCPECGTDFPSSRATFRRWAFRRVPWDRINRGSFIVAYLKTVASILFLPLRAARGLAVPDHGPRCFRWAIVHLVIIALACTMLANGRHYTVWLIAQIWPPSFDPPHMYMTGDEPASRIAVWFAQSFVAWSIVIAFPVVLGSILSIVIPHRRRAAKLGGLKWSLYLSSLFPVFLAAWYGYYTLKPPQAQATFPFTFMYQLPAPDTPAMGLAGAFGLWWAAGMAANPFNRKRSLRAFCGFALLYAASCLLIVRVLFPAGELSDVL